MNRRDFAKKSLCAGLALAIPVQISKPEYIPIGIPLDIVSSIYENGYLTFFYKGEIYSQYRVVWLSKNSQSYKKIYFNKELGEKAWDFVAKRNSFSLEKISGTV